MTLSQMHASPQPGAHLGRETLTTLRQQALRTLQSLQTPLGIMASGHDDHFHALFGRDSLWSVLLALEAGRVLRQHAQEGTQPGGRAAGFAQEYDAWLQPMAAAVLRGLTNLQGRVVNDVNEEQPGRIVHEYWQPVPPRMIEGHWPLVEGRYYGTFDATFLYLATIAGHHAYFQDAFLLDELWPGVQAALHWMLEWSDLDGDGLVEYQRRNPQGYGLSNQSWKDSSEAIRARKGELEQPLAWIEVQGYAWAAYAGYLRLAAARQSLKASLQQEIAGRMTRLQQGLSRFWLAAEHIFAIAIDGQKQPVPAVASNPGHLLWSGMLNETQAREVGERLMRTDLCTPWGLRTLSDQAYYFNPFLYQCGTVWPFDNAIIAIGMQRYGLNAQSCQIARSVLEAIAEIENPVELYMVLQPAHIRLPRLDHGWMLIDYFESCNVQAWTAAGILYLTTLLLTTEPQA
jgi:glycogen debranching enzyme